VRRSVELSDKLIKCIRFKCYVTSVRITKMLMGAAFASGASEKKFSAGKVKRKLLVCDCKVI